MGTREGADISDNERYVVLGVPNPDRLQRDLATKCRDMLNVPIRPLIVVERYQGKNVVVAHIPEAQRHEKPVYIKSKGVPKGAFRRIGSTDQHCTDEDIALFYQLRSHRPFDETPLPDVAPGDLDPRASMEYRRTRKETNPSAAELAYGDEDLLYALSAVTKHQGSLCATLAGLMLFGTPAALRRQFPMHRVDYIRVEGREWVPDPKRRYYSVELLEPLMTLIPRMVGQILDDIPKSFFLPEGSIYRRDVPLIPRDVIREALVNALMHRDHRLGQPVQIIRYANRIELHNPGYSLVPEDQLGTPGSLTRNEKIAAVLRDTGFAETKGTGIRAMREAMVAANLSAPLFDSNRRANRFAITLLLHHLLGPEEVAWLTQFKDCNLADDEARALIVLREVGAISNATYRDINRVDTLAASRRLQRLRDIGLLEQRGRGTGIHYVPGPRLLNASSALVPSLAAQNALAWRSLPIRLPDAAASLDPVDSAQPTGFPADSAGVNPSHEGLHEGVNPSHKSLREGSDRARAALYERLPEHLKLVVERFGKRSTPYEMRATIRELCAWQALQPLEIALLLRRTPRHVRDIYLRPMIRDGELEYTHPDNPAHPRQAYRATPTTAEDHYE